MKVNIDTSDMLYAEAWNGFKGTDWKEEINVRDFIQHNYTPYEGDESFLAEATPATTTAKRLFVIMATAMAGSDANRFDQLTPGH